MNLKRKEAAMNELITIKDHDGKKAVSARELSEFLEVKRDFTNWCKQMFDYGFEEGKDFTPILAKSSGGRPPMDYALTLDCAKEISMLQRSEKGKQARQYFIEMEKTALSTRPQSSLELLELAVKAIREQNATIDEIKSDVRQLKAATQTMPDVYTAAGYLTIKGIKATLQLCQKVGTKATKVCTDNGWDMGKCPDPRFGVVKTYPTQALDQAYSQISV